MPTLQTPRLLLRPFTDEDLDKMAALMADKDFMRFSLGVFFPGTNRGISGQSAPSRSRSRGTSITIRCDFP
jgi:RimJ/RimL family protein N-acetyltransferase